MALFGLVNLSPPPAGKARSVDGDSSSSSDSSSRSCIASFDMYTESPSLRFNESELERMFLSGLMRYQPRGIVKVNDSTEGETCKYARVSPAPANDEEETRKLESDLLHCWTDFLRDAFQYLRENDIREVLARSLRAVAQEKKLSYESMLELMDLLFPYNRIVSRCFCVCEVLLYSLGFQNELPDEQRKISCIDATSKEKAAIRFAEVGSGIFAVGFVVDIEGDKMEKYSYVVKLDHDQRSDDSNFSGNAYMLTDRRFTFFDDEVVLEKIALLAPVWILRKFKFKKLLFTGPKEDRNDYQYIVTLKIPSIEDTNGCVAFVYEYPTFLSEKSIDILRNLVRAFPPNRIELTIGDMDSPSIAQSFIDLAIERRIKPVVKYNAFFNGFEGTSSNKFASMLEVIRFFTPHIVSYEVWFTDCNEKEDREGTPPRYYLKEAIPWFFFKLLLLFRDQMELKKPLLRPETPITIFFTLAMPSSQRTVGQMIEEFYLKHFADSDAESNPQPSFVIRLCSIMKRLGKNSIEVVRKRSGLKLICNTVQRDTRTIKFSYTALSEADLHELLSYPATEIHFDMVTEVKNFRSFFSTEHLQEPLFANASWDDPLKIVVDTESIPKFKSHTVPVDSQWFEIVSDFKEFFYLTGGAVRLVYNGYRIDAGTRICESVLSMGDSSEIESEDSG